MSKCKTSEHMWKAESQLFAALGDATRLAIIATLSDGQPRPIHALTEQTSMSRQAVTKHLKVLERSNLVVKRKNGRETEFELRQNGLSDAQSYLDTIAQHWDSSLERLRKHVED